MSVSCHTRKSPTLFNDLVGAQQKRFGDREAERHGAPNIDEQLKPRGLLHGKTAGLAPFKYLVDVGGGFANTSAAFRPVGENPASLRPGTPAARQWKLVL